MPDEKPASDERVAALLKQPFDLKLQLGDSEVVIVDVRSAEDYAAGHVTGAVHLDLAPWKKKSAEKGGLKDEKFWAEEIGKLGINDSRQVVVYGEALPDVARAWWLMKYAGVTHVSILDGGWKAWSAAGHAASKTASKIEPAKFEPKFQTERLVELGDVLQEPRKSGRLILDTRSAEEHAAHIPGAINLEWKAFVTGEGKFKSPEEIKKLLQAQGLTLNNEFVAHCQSGGRSSVTVFALEIAGVPKVRNYYCGWSEYSKEQEAPVEKK
jgi:thiosulfate/3-mercaptopyruvate sulfurtransferase